MFDLNIYRCDILLKNVTRENYQCELLSAR